MIVDPWSSTSLIYSKDLLACGVIKGMNCMELYHLQEKRSLKTRELISLLDNPHHKMTRYRMVIGAYIQDCVSSVCRRPVYGTGM